MLEADYRAQLDALLENLTCSITLPEDWCDYFAEDGVVQTVFDERRQFVRHRYRSRGVLEIEQTLPAIERERSYYHVYARDISRCGLSFIHAEELYSGESCRLWLPSQKIDVKIMQCRRYNDHCYVIGAILASADAPVKK